MLEFLQAITGIFVVVYEGQHALNGRTVSWIVSRRDLLLLLNEAYPVILVVYDGRRDRAFWLHVQAHFADHPPADWFLAGKTVNVHLPRTNRLNRISVRTIVQHKNTIHAQLRGGDRFDV